MRLIRGRVGMWWLWTIGAALAALALLTGWCCLVVAGRDADGPPEPWGEMDRREDAPR